MPVLKNRAYVVTTTTGAGTITLGNPVAGYQSFTDAGLTTGAITRYTIQDGANWEIGLGTYTTSGTTLTRTPSESSSGGSAINLSGNAEVFIAATAEDVSPLYDANFVTQTTSSFNGPSATGTDAIAIGLDALASGTRSVGIGALATGINVGAIASGNGAVALGGSNASGLEAFSANNSRNDATFGSTGANSVTLGYQSRAQATYSIAIGYAAIAGGQYGIALGFSRANGEQSFSIGQNASTASGANTIVIGKAISSSVDNQIAIGGTGNTIKLFNAYTLPTSDGAAGTALVTDGSGALSFASAGGAFDYTRATKTANYTVVAGDLGKIIDVTSNSVTISLTAAATLGDGFYVYIRNSSSTATDVVTIDGNGSETIDGSPLIYLRRFEGIHLVCDGSGFFSLRSRVDGLQTNFAQQSHQLDQPTASGNNSLALGFQTDATNQAAISVGYQTAATGSSSMAFGNYSTASGQNALTVGMGALASDTNSVAIGSGSGAEGPRSQAAGAVAIGRYSKVVGTDGIAGPYSYISGNYGSVAFGVINTGTSYGSQGNYSVSIGQLAKATAANSIAIGDTATSTVANLIALGGTTDTVKISGAYTLPTSDGSAGTALVTNGSGALSFSSVGADLYAVNPVSATDPVVNGNNSIAIGSAAVAGSATGNNDKIAIGTGATAGNNQRVLALGYYAAAGASGQSATAVGSLAVASGPHSTAIGSGTDATATSATALGYNAQAVGSSEAIAIGNSRAGGIGTFAAQIGTNSSSYGAIGNSGTAIGGLTKTTGLDFVFGRSSIASGGSGSLSLGMDNTSSGAGSVTLGKNNTASHTDAVVIGQGASSAAADQITLGHTDQTVRISSAYTLPTSDGSSGTALVTNGSGALSFATVGAALYAANESSPSAQPSASGANAVAIGEAPTASGTDSFAVQGGTASGNGALAIGRNVGGGNVSLSRANSTIAIMGSTTTNNHYSTAIGLNSSAHLATVGGSNMGAMALGGSYASGTNSFAAAIATNSSSYGATGTSSIAMGYQSKSTGNYAVAIGSAQATGSDYGVSIGYNARSASHSTVAIGREAGLGGSGSSSVSIGHEVSSSGSESLAIGRNVVANASRSVAIGAYARVGGIIGKYAFANDYINSSGDAQQGKYVLHVSTTNATATALTSTGTAASSNNQVNLQNNSAYAFHGTIVAREAASSGTECAAWKVEGLIRREANAGTTVLVNSATTVLDNTPNWGMVLSANTSLGCLKIEVTGAAKTIRWVATIHTSEITYA